MMKLTLRWRIPVAAVAALMLASILTSPPALAESSLLKALKTRLVYASDRDGQRDIWTAGADGASPVRITGGPGLKTDPARSPDGRQVAYVTALNGFQELWITGMDGSKARQLTDLKGFVRSPSWSSDGKRLLFSFANEEEPFHPNAIMAYDMVSGKTATLLTSPDPGDMGITWFMNYPLLTADGGTLYHTRAEISTPGFPKYTGVAIYKTDLVSGTSTKVLGGSFYYDETGTRHGHWATTPDICGRDQRLVFVSMVGYTEGAICFSSSDGSEVRRVLHREDAMFRNPAATPEGRYVYYELNDANNKSQIHRYDTVRNESIKITTKGDNRSPDI